MKSKLQPLRIGDLEIAVPIIQGAMGVRVSTAPLVAAVAECGAAGTLSSVGLGYGTALHEEDYCRASREALVREIVSARNGTRGVFGVNVMVALSNYEDLVRTASDQHVAFITSGAGLPLNLPALIGTGNTKLVPIVSSARAANLIIRTWKKRYNRLPDALIVEGPMAGGHLGFKASELVPVPEPGQLDAIVRDVVAETTAYRSAGFRMPVIAAGGVYDGKDMARMLRLGCEGVQMATRFVATPECAVAQKFKNLYLKATKQDILLIDSPVGMPGRAIRNAFVDRVSRGERMPFACHYQCLKTCDPLRSPYCIAQALCNASAGRVDDAVIFCGSNVWRVDRITPVRDLIAEITAEANFELTSQA